MEEYYETDNEVDIQNNDNISIQSPQRIKPLVQDYYYYSEDDDQINKKPTAPAKQTPVKQQSLNSPQTKKSNLDVKFKDFGNYTDKGNADKNISGNRDEFVGKLTPTLDNDRGYYYSEEELSNSSVKPNIQSHEVSVQQQKPNDQIKNTNILSLKSNIQTPKVNNQPQTPSITLSKTNYNEEYYYSEEEPNKESLKVNNSPMKSNIQTPKFNNQPQTSNTIVTPTKTNHNEEYYYSEEEPNKESLKVNNSPMKSNIQTPKVNIQQQKLHNQPQTPNTIVTPTKTNHNEEYYYSEEEPNNASVEANIPTPNVEKSLNKSTNTSKDDYTYYSDDEIITQALSTEHVPIHKIIKKPNDIVPRPPSKAPPPPTKFRSNQYGKLTNKSGKDFRDHKNRLKKSHK